MPKKDRFRVMDTETDQNVPLSDFLIALINVLDQASRDPQPLTPDFFKKLVVKTPGGREN